MPSLLRPWFSYGTGPTVVSLSIPQRPWLPHTQKVGGHRVLASGLPLARVIRRDQLLDVRLRVLEAVEWPALQAMVAFLQDASGLAAQAEFRIDSTMVSGEMFYLHAPLLELKPGRDEYPGVLTADLTLRKANGTAWALDYFGS